MTNTIQTLRISLDDEMQDALKIAEEDFPGLKPTQIIRTVFLKSLKSKTMKVPTSEEVIKEFDSMEPNAMSDEDFSDWWAGIKKEIRTQKKL